MTSVYLIASEVVQRSSSHWHSSPCQVLIIGHNLKRTEVTQKPPVGPDERVGGWRSWLSRPYYTVLIFHDDPLF